MKIKMNRKKPSNLKKTIILISALCIILCMSGCESKKVKSISRTGYALNTEIGIELFGTDDEDIITECFTICNDYEKKFSRVMEGTEIYRLNENGELKVTDDVLDLIKTGLYYSKISGGAFDITIEPVSSLWNFTSDKAVLPSDKEIKKQLKYIDYSKVKVDGNYIKLEDGMGIDLGAIAKGYIADRLRDYIESKGVKSAIINLGGNVLCVGRKTDGKEFNIAVRDPFTAGKVKFVVGVDNQSVVTSGTYERYIEVDGKKYHHILNPKTGYSYENNLASVTIICDKSVDGDALSTTCFALGQEKGIELIDGIDNTWAVFIDNKGKITYSKGFKEKFNYKEP